MAGDLFLGADEGKGAFKPKPLPPEVASALLALDPPRKSRQARLAWPARIPLPSSAMHNPRPAGGLALGAAQVAHLVFGRAALSEV